MTKQEIIDLLYNEIENPDYKTVGDYHKGIADTLLAKIEQEKKETVRDFATYLKCGECDEKYKNKIDNDYKYFMSATFGIDVELR